MVKGIYRKIYSAEILYTSVFLYLFSFWFCVFFIIIIRILIMNIKRVKVTAGKGKQNFNEKGEAGDML